ncbi:hypothetical protein V1318_14270 [Lysobacter sp. CCNWLW3]|uniref:hypothetical protein n=1 Tax=unclassified Lysobacter TaxID=2635362 RepID=UPI002FD62BE6
MKRATKLLLILALIGIGGVALAKYVGRFYCANCEVGPGLADGTTLAFIREVVNRLDNQGSWVDPEGRPNQVTICNGTKCSIYTVAVMSAMFVSEGYWYSDWKGEGDASGGGGGDAGGGIGDWGGSGPVGQGPYDNCFSQPGGGGCVSVGGGEYHCEAQYTELVCPGA